jgi:hypothetical protein
VARPLHFRDRAIFRTTYVKETTMFKGLLLWLLGVPGIIIVLLLLFGVL